MKKILCCIFILSVFNLVSCNNEVKQESKENVVEKEEIIEKKEDISSAEVIFVGSKNSDFYHYPDCEWADKILEKNIIYFKSEEDAIEEGYRSCSFCGI